MSEDIDFFGIDLLVASDNDTRGIRENNAH